jgi:signal transduction histidine kinase
MLVPDYNYLIVILVTGAVLLAAVYHSMLFAHSQTTILKKYSTYLWFTLIYCGFRTFDYRSNFDGFRWINLDETIQMFSFWAYIYFMAEALNVTKEKKTLAWNFVQSANYIMPCYLLLQAANHTQGWNTAFLISKFAIRIYLLLFGFYVLVVYILKHKKTYYNYLGGGCLSMIFFGTISALSNMLQMPLLGIKALPWLHIGFFSDIILFSSAIGYRIRQEFDEKEASLKALLEKEKEIKAKELEKINAVYATREIERQRIAKDLHDDIGASLSSLRIYSSIAENALSSNPNKSTDLVHKIAEQSQQIMEDMNDIIWSMKTSGQQLTSMAVKIKNYGADLLTEKNIDCQYEIDAAAENNIQSIEARRNILLVIKEAMNNIAKYSQASKAWIKIWIDKDNLCLLVEDNGQGFDESIVRKGNGLQNMRQRLHDLGGELSIETKSGQGCRITAFIKITKIRDANFATT